MPSSATYRTWSTFDARSREYRRIHHRILLSGPIGLGSHPQDASLVPRSGFEGGLSARNARVRLVDTALRDNWWIRLTMHGQDALRDPAGDYSCEGRERKHRRRAVT